MERPRVHDVLFDGTRPWLDPEVTGVGRLPMRTPLVPYPDRDGARTHDPAASPWWRSLDGEWDFRMLACPEDLTPDLVGLAPADGGPPGDWDTISVPGAWTTQGFGAPQYTNVIMPFDLDPPAVPDRNPTGVYRRTVTVPRDWRGRRTVLRVGAAESVVVVLVDGREVGLATDSRLPSEFDITSEAPGQPQLTFGSGLHYCLGAALARAELQEALPLLAKRLPNLRLDGPTTWKPDGVGIFGPEHLPVTFDPGH